MKTHFLHIVILILAIYALSSCDKEDASFEELKEEIVPVNDTLRGVYGANILLTNDREWCVEGWTYIINGSSLRIEPGTIIKVLPEHSRHSGGGIIIVRDSKIIAKGTTWLPIKFQLTDTVQTHWNGLILMGNAPQHKVYRGWENIVLPDEREISYGGRLPNDSSGIMEHVEINFAQEYKHALPAGILLLGVGNKTRIENVILHMQGQNVKVVKQAEGYNDL